MNKYLLTSFAALLLLAIALPIYAMREPARMDQAQADLRQDFVTDAAVMYVENCAICHGADGEGIGSIPALDTDGLRGMDVTTLTKTIARGRYETAMAGWHVDEGGIFNDYQVEELVTLIRYADWPQVGELAASRGMIPPSLPIPEVNEELLAQVTALGADGAVWAEGIQLFAENCTICHGVNGEGSTLGVPLNTPEVQAKDEAELLRTVTEGVPGTLMASWNQALEMDEIGALVSFIHNWDELDAAGVVLTAPAPIQIDLNNPEEVLALGERIFTTTCTACHGENGSGGAGPALNSQQFLTTKTDPQIYDTIVQGGHRPGSIMPAFGDRMTSVEIDAVVQFIRAWEPTAPYVENPRGTEQGGGPPWLRATPDPANPIVPGQTTPSTGRGGGPAWRTDPNALPPGQSGVEPAAGEMTGEMGPTLYYQGTVVAMANNLLTFRADGASADVEAMLGPPWFWTEQGIPLAPGDRIQLEGFESADHMEVNWILNLSTGQRLDLRNEAGMPVWAGE